MSLIKIQPVGFFGHTITGLLVCDHKIVSGKPAVPAIAGDPEADPPIPDIEAIPAVPGNVDSHVAFKTDGGEAIAERRTLTAEQYAAYCSTGLTIDDDAFLTACHVTNAGLTPA